MADKKDYLDPADNPFIPGPDPDNPGVHMTDAERAAVDLNADGLIPLGGYKDKAGGADPLAGLEVEKIRKLVEASAGRAYIYDAHFYDSTATTEERFRMSPRFAIEKDGGGFSIERGEGKEGVITAEEADLLRKALDFKPE